MDKADPYVGDRYLRPAQSVFNAWARFKTSGSNDFKLSIATRLRV